jgi:squalene cyclase
MQLLPIILTTALAMGDGPDPKADTPPSREQVRQTVERSLVFLEKSGTAWWTNNKCASCHHVPITLWSLNDAKKRGLAVDDKALEQLRDWAVSSYVNHPKLRPVGQDGEEKGSSVSLNTVYLTLAVAAADKLDDKTAESVKKFAVHMLAAQDADGSWHSSATLPPVGDVTEVRTMQVLLALAAAHDKGLIDNGHWTPARDRALAWLSKHKFLDQNQSLNLQVLVAHRFGKPEEVKTLVKQLLEQQEADGGWSQTREATAVTLKDYDDKSGPTPAKAEKRPSDALATGQTLYALTVAGLDPQEPALQRAQAYLVRAQTKDGSWRVPIRSQKNSGNALSHYGTGWATLGLMQTLGSPGQQHEKTTPNEKIPE